MRSLDQAGILSIIVGKADRSAFICSCIFFSPFLLMILTHSPAASFIASLTDLPPVIAACRFLSRASYIARVPGKFIVGADRIIVSLITGTWYAWYVWMTRGSLKFASCHGSKYPPGLADNQVNTRVELRYCSRRYAASGYLLCDDTVADVLR